jgi:hypothetical protein
MTQLLNGAALAGMVGDPRSPYWVRWAATIVYGPDLGKLLVSTLGLARRPAGSFGQT